ncbi:MAG: uroporphyrinogen-III synthase [Proteobacteria bacterium]|nr:uroporphyrinogen-III synthase [Pseudomonadota bacterium]
MTTVVLTRPQSDSERLAVALKADGIHTVILPVMAISALSDGELAAPPTLDQHAVCVFISANAVRFGLWALLPRLTEAPSIMTIAVGAKTRQCLAEQGIDAVMPDRPDSEGVLAMAELDASQAREVVIVKGEGGRELLANQLRQRGAQVTEWSCYRRCWPDVDLTPLADSNTPRVFQASSGEVLTRLSELLAGEHSGDLFQSTVIVPSERVAAMASNLGWQRVICAQDASDHGFADALRQVFRAGLTG